MLDRLGNPAATTLARVITRAGDDFAHWLKDRKNRRAIPHRFEQCGYVPVRNSRAKDGLWVMGTRQVIYAQATLSLRDQYLAAMELVKQTVG